MEASLINVNSKLKNDEERHVYVTSYEEVYLAFREKLNQTDPLFETYQMKVNTGSHAINTRVGLPNEFDVNICMKLPGDLNKDVQFKNSTRDGFIQIKTCKENWERLKKNQVWLKSQSVEKWVDSDGYLIESKVRSWMESKVQNVLTSLKSGCILEKGQNIYKLGIRKSGPAFTLHVEKVGSNVNFDIDLVPAIVFEYPKWPCNVKEKFYKEYGCKEWFAVAKPLSPEEGRFWRPSLAKQEIEILSNQQHLKSVLRLLKALRTNNQMTYIPTYYINTLFMWKKKKEKSEYWKNPLSDIFMDMLKEFDEALTKKEILYYWNPQQNLLNNLKASQVQDASARLKGIIKNINRDPNNVEKYILGG